MKESKKNSDSNELDGTNILNPLILETTAWLVPVERISSQLAVLGQYSSSRSSMKEELVIGVPLKEL